MEKVVFVEEVEHGFGKEVRLLVVAEDGQLKLVVQWWEAGMLLSEEVREAW